MVETRICRCHDVSCLLELNVGLEMQIGPESDLFYDSVQNSSVLEGGDTEEKTDLRLGTNTIKPDRFTVTYN